jgi:hypothetical protein
MPLYVRRSGVWDVVDENGGGGGGGGGSSFPDGTNTGYTNYPGYTSLASGASISPVSNSVYSGYSFQGLDVGSSSTSVSNITFNGCRFWGQAVGAALVKLYGDNITFNYCSFEPNVSAGTAPYQISYANSYEYGIEADGGYSTFVEQLTMSHCDLWGFGEAIDVGGSTQTKPQVFNDNWIHHSALDGGIYHTDGLGNQSGSGTGSYVVMNHNTIQSVGNTNGIAWQAGTYDHFTVTNNLLGGFGYTVAIWGNTSTTFTGNVYDYSTIAATYGPLYPQTFWTGGTSLWRENIWKSTDAYNGQFWTPSGPSVSDYTG